MKDTASDEARLAAAIWLSDDARAVEIIDQTALPNALRTLRLSCLADTARAIRTMQVRGAPLIGVTAAFGFAFAVAREPDDDSVQAAFDLLLATRPTAVNLPWALARMRACVLGLPPAERADVAWQEARQVALDDAAQCRRIGEHGVNLLRTRAKERGGLDLMTHCNAGWLAAVAHGTALAPIYAAAAEGIPVHVWVSETRPRNQGLLTAWELRRAEIAHTFFVDNAAGVLLASGRIDAVIVGADRIAQNGDVANKVGTYLKALAARAAGVPFYVAAPSSTIDFACETGAAITIEERGADEVRFVAGCDAEGSARDLRQLPAVERVANPAFDITPASLVSALITERGHCPASRGGLRALYPEFLAATPRPSRKK